MTIISMIFMSMQNRLFYGIDKDILVDEIEDYLNSTDIVVIAMDLNVILCANFNT